MTRPKWTRFPATALALALAGSASWSGSLAAERAADSAPWPSSDRIVPIADRVVAAGDNQGLPFAVIDKETAQLAVYDAGGELRGMAPVLIGAAVGDDSAPGVGERALADIAPEERTTPAGRFYGGFGQGPDGSPVLWVDYATAISVHPVIDTNPAERRPERLLSPASDDNRVTFGCINVAAGFYEDVVAPAFAAGGIFYVLPEASPFEAAFPSLADGRALAAAPPLEAAGF